MKNPTDTADSDEKKPKAEASKPAAQTSDEAEKLKQQLAEYEARWKRALADYQNLEKRTEERQRDFVQFAVKGFVDQLLPAMDDLELANTHLKDKGLELALKKLARVLKEHGLERIETKDKEYDIQTMEAISIIEGEKDNQVVAEHRPGYLMHGSVLRPAQVTVSKKKNNE